MPEGATPISDEEAEKLLLEKVNKTQSEFQEAVLSLARFYSQVGKQGEAASYIQQLIVSTDSPESKAFFYLTLGQLMEQVQDYQNAVKFYLQAFSLEPVSNRTWYFINNNLGFCLNHFGRFKDAEPYCRSAIQIDPNRYNAHKNLGISLQGLGQLAKAAKCFISAVRKDSNDPRALKHLEELVVAHPTLAAELPDIDRQLQNCCDAVRVASEYRQKRLREQEAQIRASQPKGRKLRVLVGDFPDHFPAYIGRIIDDATNHEREVVVTHTYHLVQLMELAQGQQFDLCVVVLNNLPGLPRRDSPDGQAAFIAKLKQACRCPVMALAGWPDDVSLGEKVMYAGASYFSRLPFPIPEFTEAVKKCLALRSDLTPIRKPKILVTDDCKPALDCLKAVLEPCGYEVVIFESKAEAVGRLGEIKPDLVTTDLGSPGMGGLEFIRLVKEFDQSIPVIIISGHETIESAREAVRLGVIDYLLKPFDVTCLRLAVEQALKTRGAE
jgi:CheY-like chemotaxis protein/tetratricopeptide (TPR) repeat protein